jgi:hypothetical protein
VKGANVRKVYPLQQSEERFNIRIEANNGLPFVAKRRMVKKKMKILSVFRIFLQ